MGTERNNFLASQILIIQFPWNSILFGENLTIFFADCLSNSVQDIYFHVSMEILFCFSWIFQASFNIVFSSIWTKNTWRCHCDSKYQLIAYHFPLILFSIFFSLSHSLIKLNSALSNKSQKNARNDGRHFNRNFMRDFFVVIFFSVLQMPSIEATFWIFIGKMRVCNAY